MQISQAVIIELHGDWLLGNKLPGASDILELLNQSPKPSSSAFNTSQLGDWDTGLIITLIAILEAAELHGVKVSNSQLPEGAQKLIELAGAVKKRTDAERRATGKGFSARVGEMTLEAIQNTRDLLNFIGELTLSFGRLLRGRATYLKSDVSVHIQEAGAEALPIVGLIGFLIGMIFAFVGMMQLQDFGAGIYTADLVAVGMIREIAPLITAIIMAGRTGAAYAAQIGTMKVNEEIDALTTLGINPIDFLVTPRVIALVLMMPLLTMFASLAGILGGTVVSLSILDVTLIQYVEQTIDSTHLNSLFGGLFKSLVYGALVAIAGSMQGMACGDSAMAVGVATTRAVVMGIVMIVISASVLTVIYINLGI